MLSGDRGKVCRPSPLPSGRRRQPPAGAPAPRRPGPPRGAGPDGRRGRLPQRSPHREGRVGAAAPAGARPRGRRRRRGGRGRASTTLEVGDHVVLSWRPHCGVARSACGAATCCARWRAGRTACSATGSRGGGAATRRSRRWAGSARSRSRPSYRRRRGPDHARLPLDVAALVGAPS